MSSIWSKLVNLGGNITGTLPVANGGTGVTTSTGSVAVVLSTSPTLVTPILGVAASTSVSFASSGANQTALNTYSEDDAQTSTFSFDGSGGTSGSITLSLTKVGRVVTLQLPTIKATTGTSSTSLVANTGISAAYRPAATLNFPCFIIANNVSLATIGIVAINTSGVISIFKDNAITTWTNSQANSGLDRTCICTWRV